MAQTPSQQIQVIPQPLTSAQLQQLYMPQQHIILPGNVTLQQGNNVPSQGVSLQLHAKQSVDSKTFGVHNIQPYQNAVILQPKQTYSAVQNHVLGNQVKAMSPRTTISSPTSGTLYSHPQLLGSYALSPLPPGYAWASSPSNFSGSQNPIIISREQPNIYLQSQSQAPLQLPIVSGQMIAPTSLSCSQFSQGVQSIATQTSAPSSLNSGTICFSSQLPQEKEPLQKISYLKNVQVKANIAPKINPEQNVQTSTGVANSVILEKITEPSLLISSPSINEQSSEDSQISTSKQNETTNTETVLAVPSGKDESQFSTSPIVQVAEAVPSTVPVLSENTCSAEVSVDMCTSPISAVSSTSAPLDIQPSISSTEELSSDFVPRCDDNNVCLADSKPQSVPEQVSKPVADVKPVPENVDHGAGVPENTGDEHSVKQPEAQKMAQFNPVIRLKRLRPHDPILTPYSNLPKDKQPQKAIVKPQMLSHVVDSYVVQEVTLKSVSDSSSSEISASPISEGKREVTVLGNSVPEKEEPLPVMKVNRGRGRPKGSGRKRKKIKQVVPIRRSSRQKAPVSFIEDEEGDITIVEEEENHSTFGESSNVGQTSDENFPPHNATDSDLSFDISTLAAVSSEIGKAVPDVHKKSPELWSVQEVFEFVRDFPGCLEFADTFKAQEIDGQALLLMKLDHLMTGMHMKLGPALKLIAHISSMKEQGYAAAFEAVGGMKARIRQATVTRSVASNSRPRRRRGRPPIKSSSWRRKVVVETVDLTDDAEIIAPKPDDSSLFCDISNLHGSRRSLSRERHGNSK